MCINANTKMCSTSGNKSEKLFKITEKEGFGRLMVATRDIFPGEMIIDELPLVTGPVSDKCEEFELSPKSCLVCCRRCENLAQFTCDKCGLSSLCSLQCAQNAIHAEQECKIFQSIVLQSQSPKFPTAKVFYNFVLTIRALFVQFRSPKLNWPRIEALESKVKELEKVGAFTQFSGLFSLLKWEYFGWLPEEKDSIEVVGKKCVGAMRTNAFSTFTSCHAREGLYFLSSFMSHNCCMNTDRRMEGERGRMVTTAAVLIREGEPITTSYLSLLNGTHERWKETRESWLFTCTCSRCTDTNYEMGTNLSTMKCPGCSELTLFPRVCKEDCSLLWGCGKCEYRSKEDQSIWNALEAMELSKPKEMMSDVDVIESWLRKCGEDQQVLHENHSMIIQMKLYLAQLYGRNLENGIRDLSTRHLNNKMKHCESVLKILDVLLPGFYLIKGTILFELWASLQEIKTRNNKGQLTHENIDTSDDRVSKIVKDAIDILKYSLPQSSEEAMLKILQDQEDFT